MSFDMMPSPYSGYSYGGPLQIKPEDKKEPEVAIPTPYWTDLTCEID
jgi:hypothetical protein